MRGVVTVVESLKLGSQALRWSAELYEQDLRAEEEAAQLRFDFESELARLNVA